LGGRRGGAVADHFGGAIFDADGVLVDSPHERAWRDALKELMETEWSDLPPSSSYSPEHFTPQVYQQVMSGKAAL
jgi:beta-phosphoglucomutase-like phosphatase (HAD superfamily)